MGQDWNVAELSLPYIYGTDKFSDRSLIRLPMGLAVALVTSEDFCLPGCIAFLVD